MIDALPIDDPARLVPDPEALALVDRASARRHGVLPLGLETDGEGGATLALATPAPADVLGREAVRALVAPRARLRWHAAPPAFVAGALDLLDARANARARAERGAGATPDDAAEPVDALLHAAVAARASDLHLTPGPHATRVRHRVDGTLRDAGEFPGNRHAGVAVRLKVMAGLDIAECRLPQDGAFERLVRARPVDFRLSCFPSIHGESLVLRVLDARGRPADLDALGLEPGTRAALARLVGRPGGLLVVAGPTGSGKSTTLHALLGTLAVRGLAIATLEDPVEHRLAGACQCSIDPARGLDHAAGVRALLRQDPDVLMIGEIRDAASCRMALRAAAAGHRVVATVHAADAPGALERLVELGAGEGDARALRGALSRALTAVAGQRLVGRPCGCGAAAPSCARCGGRGLAGRFALVELLELVPEVAEALRRGAPSSALRAAAGRAGFVPLARLAREAVARGATTSAEVRRTLGDAAVRAAVPAPVAVPPSASSSVRTPIPEPRP